MVTAGPMISTTVRTKLVTQPLAERTPALTPMAMVGQTSTTLSMLMPHSGLTLTVMVMATTRLAPLQMIVRTKLGPQASIDLAVSTQMKMAIPMPMVFGPPKTEQMPLEMIRLNGQTSTRMALVTIGRTLRGQTATQCGRVNLIKMSLHKMPAHSKLVRPGKPE